MLCLSLVKRYLITILVRYNRPPPPFPDNTALHSTSGLTSGFSEASLVSGVFKMASSVVASHSRPQRPSFLNHVVFRYRLSRVVLGTRMGGKLS